MLLEYSIERRGALMVSTLDSESIRLGLSAGQGHCIVLCSWARRFTFTVPLFTQEYKWVPANCQGNLTNAGVTCDGLAFHPGEDATLLVASCYGNWSFMFQGRPDKSSRLVKNFIPQTKFSRLMFGLRDEEMTFHVTTRAQ